MTTGEVREVDPVIVFMATRGLSAGLLRDHVDDGTGHCQGCSWPQGTRPVHPCLIRWYAEVAADVEAQAATHGRRLS
jgi:hypothetical protein